MLVVGADTLAFDPLANRATNNTMADAVGLLPFGKPILATAADIIKQHGTGVAARCAEMTPAAI
jgi:hypothetical protein